MKLKVKESFIDRIVVTIDVFVWSFDKLLIKRFKMRVKFKLVKEANDF